MFVCVYMRKRVNILCVITNDGAKWELQTPYIMFYRIVYNFISYKNDFCNDLERFPANFVREQFVFFILVKPKMYTFSSEAMAIHRSSWVIQ